MIFPFSTIKQKARQAWGWTIDKIRRGWKLLIAAVGIGIILAAAPTGIPQLPNSADQIDSKVKTEYPNAVEVLEKRTENGKVYDLGGGRFLLRTSIGKVHYKDAQNKFQNIEINQKNSDIAGLDVLVDTTPYKLYISDKGDRRIYPDRNKPEYISLPSPAFLNKPGKWISNRELKWESQNYDVSLTATEDRIKFLAVIKKPVQFSNFSFPVQENGARLLDYLGDISYWDSSEIPITKQLGLNYQGGILTLDFDLSGMIYPVYIDPTFSVATGTDDAFIYAPNNFVGTATALDCGAFASPALYNNNYARFQSINIPQSSTINSAYITYMARTTSTDSNINFKIAAENVDDAAAITSFADFVGRATTTGVDWDMSGWGIGTSNNSPDISTEIQTVVNRAGWTSNNAMNIFCFNDNAGGTPRRTQFLASFENTTYTEPRLTITWTEPGGAVAPTPQVIIIE